jgi:hypothetical protein
MRPKEVAVKESFVLQPCVECGTKTLGWGKFIDGFVCSKKCNEEHRRNKYLAYTDMTSECSDTERR